MLEDFWIVASSTPVSNGFLVHLDVPVKVFFGNALTSEAY